MPTLRSMGDLVSIFELDPSPCNRRGPRPKDAYSADEAVSFAEGSFVTLERVGGQRDAPRTFRGELSPVAAERDQA